MSPDKQQRTIGDLTLSLAHPKLLKSFNTWLVGGAYSPRSFSRTADYSVTVEKKKAPILEPEASQGEDVEKQSAKEQNEQKQGKSRARCQARHHYVRKSTTGQHSLDPVASRLKAANSEQCEKPPEESSEPLQESTNKLKISVRSKKMSASTTSNLTNFNFSEFDRQLQHREQLKNTLIDKSGTSSYQTLFPPLFSPYDRTPNIIRTWTEIKGTIDPSERSPRRPIATPKVPVTESNPITVIKNGATAQHRHKPRIPGQQAFMPTGSTVTAYRVFTNYRLALDLADGADEEALKKQLQMQVHYGIPTTSDDTVLGMHKRRSSKGGVKDFRSATAPSGYLNNQSSDDQLGKRLSLSATMVHGEQVAKG
uniref:Uncharacterized protein n=1 Tax=Eutreptiella gymnastica TaxID=73025 RepID=A0A7S4CUW9_9EUGL